MIELDRHYYAWEALTYYSLAAIYAFKGDRDKAYENLKLMNQIQRMPLLFIQDLKYPIFDNIRDEPEFQQIIRDVEAKYQG